MPSMRTEELERNREPTRDRILAAAARLFAQSGYGATTVKDIARECALTDPALYYHFPSKREILNALLVGPPFEHLEMRSALQLTHEALAADAWELFALVCEHGALLRLMFRQGLEEDLDTRVFSEQVRESFRAQMEPSLRKAYSQHSEKIYEAIIGLMAGLQLDAMMEFGDDYQRRVRSPEFRRRVRDLIEATLPPLKRKVGA